MIRRKISHCAERTEEAIPIGLATYGRGWRRFARNDSLGFAVAGAIALLAIITPAQAVRPDETLADPVLETRAREVSRELRCLVCRNQSIDDSDADLAHDLRVLVRERLKAGDSNDQAIAFVRARYGDFVLLRPPFEIGTALLWGGPLLVLLLGGVAVARLYRRREASTPPLSPEERQRLSAVLAEEEGSR
ncbi:MAG: cytochrome c-type biogenesis protein CcmH [Alphaproteobacteria bacterium]|nr:cytochrome c-type biogenesis protein CcmH [Alphaproteobacteria bacterium]MBV9017800.1 cytochrome c-type biogenesis protein CcmH [Alphaproteobacteria bacterium]MBV9150191.1 cytochrome c-type biogenesis protein CcmH [Alphaproteobacteria bacterium]